MNFLSIFFKKKFLLFFCLKMPCDYLILFCGVQCIKHHVRLLTHIRNEGKRNIRKKIESNRMVLRSPQTTTKKNPYAIVIGKRLQFCKMQHANALCIIDSICAVDFAAIAATKPMNRPILKIAFGILRCNSS